MGIDFALGTRAETDLLREGAVVLITGASRGLGPVIAEAFSQRGARLVLVARDATALERVASGMRARGASVLCVPTDLADQAQLARLVARCHAELGRIDVLVNNAALEQVDCLEQLSAEDTTQYINVNLTAPIQLSRLVLADMLARDTGHIVNLSSVAGFGGAAFGETYGATKAGLVGFTRSLRASLKTRGSAVSASVICPGFVSDTGMFADLQRAHALRAPAILGTCTPRDVARAVLRAIERDTPEAFVGRRPLRLMFAIGLLFPRLLERLSRVFGVHALFLRAVNERGESSNTRRPA